MSIDTYPPLNGSTPAAVLAYVPVTNTQSGIGNTEVDIAGYVAPIFAVANRNLKITVQGHLYQASSEGESVIIKLKRDGVSIGQYQKADKLRADHSTGYSWVWFDTPSPGAHVYTATIQRMTAPGVATVFHRSSATGENGFILVEDITGGTGGPGPIFLGKVENFASAQSINSATPVDITGAVLPINVPPGRMIRLRGKIHVSASGAAGTRARLLIQEGGTVLDGAYMVISGASFGEEMEAVAYVNPTPGAHTYKLTLSRDNGSTAVVIYSNAGDAMTSLVAEDITGTAAPTGAYYEALWTPVTTFTNSWVNYGGTYPPAAYRKINDLVYLRGLIKSGTISTSAFTLPVGYRPLWDHHFTALSNSLLAGVRVYQNGNVSPGDPGSNLWVALDGIVFGVT